MNTFPSSSFPLPPSIPGCQELMGVRKLQISGNQSWESARSWITLQNSPSILSLKAGWFIFPVATPKYPCSISCLPIFPLGVGTPWVCHSSGMAGKGLGWDISTWTLKSPQSPPPWGVFHDNGLPFLFEIPLCTDSLGSCSWNNCTARTIRNSDLFPSATPGAQVLLGIRATPGADLGHGRKNSKFILEPS